MRFQGYVLRVSKGKDFILIDLLTPDGKVSISTEPLGGVALSKKQWQDLKRFVEQNPGFEDDVND
jgi:hypothetical protein